MDDELIKAAWKSLKNEVCVNPETAIRCVIVSEESFRAAMRKVFTEHAELLRRLSD